METQFCGAGFVTAPQNRLTRRQLPQCSVADQHAVDYAHVFHPLIDDFLLSVFVAILLHAKAIDLIEEAVESSHVFVGRRVTEVLIFGPGTRGVDEHLVILNQTGVFSGAGLAGVYLSRSYITLKLFFSLVDVNEGVRGPRYDEAGGMSVADGHSFSAKWRLLSFRGLGFVTNLLNTVEARVLGALVEKEITTPEYYPLSLNALVNACNQKNNREPVMSLDEDTVRQALHGLEDDRLAGPRRGGDSRVTKYEHHLQEVFNFTRGEGAVLCVLLLRGAQTPGELRGRTERMHRFEELEDVLGALQRLIQREPPLAKALPRQPGTKETRYVHLLSGEVEELAIESGYGTVEAASSDERLARLEAEVIELRHEVAELKERLGKIVG